ncbi:hypothetical protein M514_05110, partial [Trichuris suis]
MEQTMSNASALYDQFMQKSEQMLEMPAKFVQLAESATVVSAKIQQAVKSFAHFNGQLKDLADYFNQCEGAEKEFCRDIMTVHQKFCLLQEEAKSLSERLVVTFAEPVVSDQKVYSAHVKHMITICSGVYVMNFNVKKSTKKLSCIKKKPLKWKADILRYKRLLKPVRRTMSMHDVGKNKYELFFLKALRDLSEDHTRQGSLFVERLCAAAVVQLPTEEVNVETRCRKEIQSVQKCHICIREPNDHTTSNLPGESKAAAEKTKSQTITEKPTTSVPQCSSVVSIFESTNKTALSSSLMRTKKSESSSNALVKNCSNSSSGKTATTVSSQSASTKVSSLVSGRQNKIQAAESKMSKLISLTKQQFEPEAKTKKPSYRRSTIASSRKVSLRYEDRIRRNCQSEEAERKRFCTSKPLKEQDNIQSSKTANFVSKIPRSKNAFKQSASERNSNSDTSVPRTVDSGHKRNIGANSKLICAGAFGREETLKEEKVSLIQEIDCRQNTLSSTTTPKRILKISPEEYGIMLGKKGDNGKRVVLMRDQSMETKGEERADAVINVSLQSD